MAEYKRSMLTVLLLLIILPRYIEPRAHEKVSTIFLDLPTMTPVIDLIFGCSRIWARVVHRRLRRSRRTLYCRPRNTQQFELPKLCFADDIAVACFRRLDGHLAGLSLLGRLDYCHYAGRDYSAQERPGGD
jgi:hypothetical protein